MDSRHDTSICLMQLEDLKQAVAWAKKENWNPILNAAEAYYATDPSGYFLLKKDNETIATLSQVKYGNGFAFIGFYIVTPTLRGQGYGKYLWDEITKHNKPHDAIALDGVVAQEKNYQASGFVLETYTTRYAHGLDTPLTTPTPHPQNITLSTDIDTDDLVQYDQAVFSQDRSVFLAHWAQLPNTIRIAAMKHGKICGYGQIVKATEGYRIAPLFADDVDIASYLYQALCQQIQMPSTVYIDMPDNQPEGAKFLRQWPLRPVFKTVRMYYHGNIPTRQAHKEFGRTKLEIG